MSEFHCFSEAARLYAENVPVIKGMQTLMLEDLERFAGSLCEAVRERIHPLPLAHGVYRGSWCNLWVPRDGDDVPWVTFDKRAEGIISPGELKCFVNAGEAWKIGERKEQLLNLGQDASPLRQRWGKSRDGWSLLSVVIAYGSGNPIEAAAPVIATMLEKLAALTMQPVATSPPVTDQVK